LRGKCWVGKAPTNPTYEAKGYLSPERGGLFNPPQTFEFLDDVQHNTTIKTL